MPSRITMVAAILAVTLLAAPARPSAPTVQEIMDSHIDPSADSLWGAVGWVETAHGETFRQPRSSQEWRTLRQHADRLIRGAVLLTTARTVGGNGNSALADASTPGIRTAVQIQRDIATDPARFAAAAHRLEAAGRDAATAIESRDAAGLVDAGAKIDAACEACHAAYWYPRTTPLPLPSIAEYARFPARHAAQPPHAQFSN